MQDGLHRRAGHLGGVLQVAEASRDVLSAVGEGRQIRVGERQRDDLVVRHSCLQLGEPLLGDGLVLPGDGGIADLDAVALRHRVDTGQQIRIDHPGHRKLGAQRDHLLEAPARSELRGEVVVGEDRGLLLVGTRLGSEVGRRDQRPEIGDPGPGITLVLLPGKEGPLDAEDLLVRGTGSLS